MTPFETIRQKYLSEPEDNPFEWYLEQHFLRGYVHSTPDFFAMGLPVFTQDLRDGYSPLSTPRCAPNCWYVSAMAGEMPKVWEVMPYPLPYVAFHRGWKEKRLMIYETSRIRARTA